MKKRITVILAVVCMLCLLLVGCKKELSANEAYQVVLEHLGNRASSAKTPHIHDGQFNGEPCYNIYLTVGEESLVYVISVTGEILSIGEGAHNH